MKMHLKLLTTSILIPLFLRGDNGGVGAYQIGNDPFTREEWLDPENAQYLLRWHVDWNTERITFNVTVSTTGWVAFGLSNNGTVEAGADVVIGGVDGSGKVYFTDRHLDVGATIPEVDSKQNWVLEDSREIGRTHTFLSFSRQFDTCDEDEYPITLNKVTLLWAYGTDDKKSSIDSFNYARRGLYHTHLLDPDYSPEITRDSPNSDPILITKGRNELIPEDTRAFTVRRSWLMETNETSYICSIHKGPRLQRKHHYIGFEMHLPNELSRKHCHHLLLYKCHPPRGTSAREFFEPSLFNPGAPCYGVWNYGKDLDFPVQFCTQLYMVWGIGGRPMFFQNHVGIPIGEELDEYYMFEHHYDNPEGLPGIRVETQANFFYTSELRANDGGVSGVAVLLPGLPESLLVPPNSEGHRAHTHCSPECITRLFPNGVNISAVIPHSHNAGVGLRLRHFRGGKELPWIVFDDNYDNQVQPFRILKEERRVLPGDQLTVECHYSTNRTAVSGFSTRQEMCNCLFLYHTRIPDYAGCWSGINSPEARERFLGVRNVSWIQDRLDWVVNTPSELANLTVTEVSDGRVNWTPGRRRALQVFHEQGTHTSYCTKDVYTMTLEEYISSPEYPPGVFPEGPMDSPAGVIGPVRYPFEAEPYSPPPGPCLAKRR